MRGGSLQAASSTEGTVFLRRSLFAGLLAVLALHVPQIARAQDAIDTAGTQERSEHFDRAITQLSNAWREADLSLR